MMLSEINIAAAKGMAGAGSKPGSTHPRRRFQPRRLLAALGEAEPAEPPHLPPAGAPLPPGRGRQGAGEPVPVLNSNAGSFSPSPRSFCSIM